MSDSLLPPSIRDERFLALEALVNRIAELDLAILDIYDIDQVEASALYDLADQFNVLGFRGWMLAGDEAERRSLIKESIVLHRKAGTAYAVRRAMALVGYPSATVIENPPLAYDGTWSYDGSEVYVGKRLGGFVVVLDPVQSAVSGPLIELIVALINEWKNTRSHLLDLRIGAVSLFRNLLQYDGSWNYNGLQEYDAEKNI